jgi:hypothetical protein
VQVIELSNHPRDLLAEAAAPRLAAEAQAKQDWQRACEVRAQRIEALRAKRAQARSALRIWSWLRAAVKLAFLEVPGVPAPPRALWRSHEEHARAAGVEGEDGVVACLDERLGEEWHALRGYRNSRGEIDLLLLGPHGVFAIEIKNNNATVICHGDRWLYEKYDKYGNQVGEGELSDRRGRSPSEQLNQPTDRLASVLAARWPQLWVERIVVLCHPRARVDIDRSSQFTVAVANNVDFVLELIARSQARIGAMEVAEIEASILADHHRHKRQPAGRS